MKSLDELAIHFGTDKSSKGHSYTQYYELMLGGLRDKEVNLLEIGVDKGASLQMWDAYFNRALIWGIDIEDKSQYDGARIKTLVCDQSSPDSLADLKANVPELDIIIEDGSHVGSHQFTSFVELYPHLKVGGIYVIEDVLCSFDSRWNEPMNIRDRIKDMIDQVNMSGFIPNSSICANKQEAVLKYQADYMSLHVEWIMVCCGIVFIKKM